MQASLGLQCLQKLSFIDANRLLVKINLEVDFNKLKGLLSIFFCFTYSGQDGLEYFKNSFVAFIHSSQDLYLI